MELRNFLRRFYPLILIAVVFLVWKIRQNNTPPLQETEISGMTMGTIGYSVKYYNETGENYSDQIDSLLKVWNQSLSTYIPNSEISRFNKNDDCFEFESAYFLPVLETAQRVFEMSGGAFDPTVGPLVNAWGFGPDEAMAPDSSKVDSLLYLVGYNKIKFDQNKVCKDIPGIKLDFSAIAKGYAVDVVAEFLEAKGIENLLVEIGGELICKGTKPDNKPWRTAIEDPEVGEYERKVLAVVQLKDRAVATSGNYRNYYVKDGRKYVHTINPATGYPVIHNLLSASVFADDCMTADAFATAFMVLGVKKSQEILNKDNSLDAYLIYIGDDGKIQTYITKGIAPQIEQSDAED